MGRFAVGLAIFAALATAAAVKPGPAYPAASGPQGGALEVVVESSLLSVRISGASLSDVLQVIGQRAGVTIVVRGDLALPVVQSFTNLPLDEGIRRLIRGHSAVFIYGADGASNGPAPDTRLAEVWVTAFSGRASQSAATAPRSPAIVSGNMEPQPARAAAVLPPSGRGAGQLAAATERDSGPEWPALRDKNPGVRLQAIQGVLRDQGTRSVDAIAEVLWTDPAPHVRRAALQALASMNTEEARGVVTAALSDGDPVIRNAAARAHARWRDQVR
jgi:hypothetical protein